MERHKRIDMDPKVMFGKPVIKNTRITVEHVLRKLSGGDDDRGNYCRSSPYKARRYFCCSRVCS